MARNFKNISAKSAAGIGLLVAAAGIAGCDWSLSMEQNMLEMAEELLLGPKDKDDGSGEGGAGNSGGSGGGAAGGSGEQEPSEEESEADGPAPEGRAMIAIGGRSWAIDGLCSLPSTGDPNGATVALLAALNLSGAQGEAVLLLPRGQWPLKDDGTPWTFSTGEPPTTRDGTGGLELAGRKYTLEFVSSTARLDMTPTGPRLRGSVEAHAKLDPAPTHRQATPQLLKVSFDLEAE